MDRYDDKTDLPLDILSFMLHMTFPGHYIFERKSLLINVVKAFWQTNIVAPSQEAGWDTRLMGSISDGLYAPEDNHQLMDNEMLPSHGFTMASDCDVWLSRPDLSIGFMPTSAPLIADATDCPPGYFRVKPNTTASAKTVLSRNIHQGILLPTVVDGEMLLQFTFVRFGFPKTMIHGPAIRCIKPVFGLTEDYVPVLICKEWPELGHRWERRQRRSGWPSAAFISDLKKLGCDFVQTPSHNSKNPEVEWRIAFSLIEQKLCQSFTAVQKQCFIIAKVLMKKKLKSCEGYSTYLLKNTMFWMMEDNLSSDWQSEDALASFIILLLKTFRGYLNKGILPHYFIEKRNLIGHIHAKIRKEMLEKTDSVCNSLHDYIFLHCFHFSPLEISYPIHRKLCLSTIDIVVKCNPWPHELLVMKQEILGSMMILLAMESRFKVLVNTLIQHGHILEPLVDHSGSTPGDEKAWIFRKVAMVLNKCDTPTHAMRNFLSQRLYGMLCIYYCNLCKDKSLLKSASDHFREVINNFDPIFIVQHKMLHSKPICYVEHKMPQPELHIFQALVMIGIGDYQQAWEIIRFVMNNEQWLDDTIRFPAEFYSLLNTLLQADYVDTVIYLGVYDAIMYMKVQLFVLTSKFVEAESLMESWRNFLPLDENCPDGHKLLGGLGYVWVSNFTNAAQIFQSMGSDHGFMLTDNIGAICQSLSRIVKS